MFVKPQSINQSIKIKYLYGSLFQDGGLYNKLYLCLFYTISELTKLSHAVDKKECAIKSKLNTL